MAAFALVVLGGCCAFLMGYAANQGGTCAVMAARELVERRRARLFAGFVLAASTGGLIYLPAAWATGDSAHVVGEVTLGVSLLLGAVLLGVGATVNGACLLGSLWRLGNGEFRLLGLPLGLAIGDALVVRGFPGLLPELNANSFGRPGAGGVLFVAAFLPLLVASRLWLRGREAPARVGRWRLSNAMMVLGLSGAPLFLLQPSATYADLVQRSIATSMIMTLGGSAGYIAAGLTVLGALVSAIRAGAFRPRWPDLAALGRTIIGGTLMAAGANLIPGGNDALLFAAVPGGSRSGLVAYALMTTTVLGLVFVLRRSARSPAKVVAEP